MAAFKSIETEAFFSGLFTVFEGVEHESKFLEISDKQKTITKVVLYIINHRLCAFIQGDSIVLRAIVEFRH